MSGSDTNWEAHNVVNYAKLKEQYRVSELANDVNLTGVASEHNGKITRDYVDNLW